MFCSITNLKTVIAAALACSVALTTACDRRSSYIRANRDAVVLLTVRYANTGKPVIPDVGLGTGFFVGRDLIATAGHVIKALQSKASEFPAGSAIMVAEKYDSNGERVFSRSLKPVYVDDATDIALLKIIDDVGVEEIGPLEVTLLPVSDELPEIGDEVIQTGFGSDSVQPLTTIGSVAMISDSGNGPQVQRDMVYTDLTSLPGNSGSPVFSVKSGKIIGIAVRVATPSLGMARISIAAKSSKLVKTISDYRSQTAIP